MYLLAHSTCYTCGLCGFLIYVQWASRFGVLYAFHQRLGVAPPT